MKNSMIFMVVMDLALRGKESGPQEKFYFQLKV